MFDAQQGEYQAGLQDWAPAIAGSVRLPDPARDTSIHPDQMNCSYHIQDHSDLARRCLSTAAGLLWNNKPGCLQAEELGRGFTSAVLGYTKFCTDNVIMDKNIQVHPNRRLWMNRKVQNMLRERNIARASPKRGDMEAKTAFKRRTDDFKDIHQLAAVMDSCWRSSRWGIH